jgi:hypothetical protein
MKLEELLRHVADNVENGRELSNGLLYNGSPSISKIGITSLDLGKPELYTLAPRMVRINGIEVKAGMSEAPYGGDYYISGFNHGRPEYMQYTWNGNNSDKLRLESGLVFPLNEQGKQDAIAMAKAMLSFEEV